MNQEHSRHHMSWERSLLIIKLQIQKHDRRNTEQDGDPLLPRNLLTEEQTRTDDSDHRTAALDCRIDDRAVHQRCQQDNHQIHAEVRRTDEQKQNNRSKSKIRCRVEHVFGFIERSMGGLVFRGIGIVRAKANVAMTNLTYNIARLTQIYRHHRGWLTV